MSDTPRTDAEDAIWQRDYNNHRECDWPPISDVVSSDFARQLERELGAANERIKRLEEALELLVCGAEKVQSKGYAFAQLDGGVVMARTALAKHKETKP